MIYTKDYTDQEMSKSTLSGDGNKWRIYVYCILCVLVSVVLTLLLNSLDSTIVSEALPTFTGANAKSSFALLTFLAPIIMLFTIGYYFGNYQNFTFAELHTNRMYMLIKMGAKMKQVILLRIYSALSLPLFLYAISFIISVFTCLLFNYSINILAMPGQFLAGVIIIVLITMIILTLSLFFYNEKYAILAFIGVALLIIALGVLTNFTNVIQASINVSNLGVMFGGATGYFLFICLGLIVVCFVISLVRSFNLIKYYSTIKETIPGIVVIDYSKNVVKAVKKDNSAKKEKIFNGTIMTIFIAFVAISFATNLFLIYMATNNLESQSLYNNYVPIIFGSETMRQGDSEVDSTLSYPQFIEKNDLAVFENTSNQDININVGNVIYYINSDTSSAVIVKVKLIDSDGYHVDVTYYPNQEDAGTLATTLTRTQIKGRLVYVNRVVGAWVTLNDAVIGKIVFLVIPLFIIIFYDKIRKFNKAYKTIEDKDLEEKKK